ncbi:hypothetical protein [Roseobacter sp. HKCCD7870]|uniref:hypothetical protein n=1 Tax=Roseobacter sp. HKCCD7870 TaxID=3120343 RepID=UPI0030EE5CE0
MIKATGKWRMGLALLGAVEILVTPPLANPCAWGKEIARAEDKFSPRLCLSLLGGIP